MHSFLTSVTPQDIFNEYTIGRSAKCDIRAEKAVIVTNTTTTTTNNNNNNNKNNKGADKKLKARQDWCYGMISNRHCKIYCTLDATVCGLVKA